MTGDTGDRSAGDRRPQMPAPFAVRAGTLRPTQRKRLAMPDLTLKTVEGWLVGTHSDGPPPPVRPIEREPDVARRLDHLGSALDAAATADALALSRALRGEPLRGDLQAVLAQLGAGRALRLLSWLGEVDLPECHQAVAALLASGGDTGAALRAALAAVARRTTLASMLAPERIAALRAATQDAKEPIPS